MDTADWSVAEIGAYFRLLMAEWVNGPLPNDTSRLARIAGLDHGNFKKMWGPILNGKFIPNGDGTLFNKRLEQEREKQRQYSESRQKGAAEKWRKEHAHADAHALHSECIPDALQSSSLQSSKKKKIKDIVSKISFGENSLVKLTQEEFDKLVKKFGPEVAEEIIDTIGLKIASKGESVWRKDHNSDYATILYWHRQGFLEKKKEDKYI